MFFFLEGAIHLNTVVQVKKLVRQSRIPHIYILLFRLDCKAYITIGIANIRDVCSKTRKKFIFFPPTATITISL